MGKKVFQRRLAAILSADVEGYTRLMQNDEEATIQTLSIYRKVIADIVQRFGGRVVDSPGDNILIEFKSAIDSVNGAVEIQGEIAKRNTDLTNDRKMQFRIGINLGDIVEEGQRVYGDGVNIAARVERLAERGGICVTEAVYQQVKTKLKNRFESLGAYNVKNIPEPLKVYRFKRDSGDLSKLNEKISYLGAKLSLPDKPSIAVLPFNNLTGDESLEYLSDGITDSIISTLSKVGELFVIDRHSVFSFKNKHVKVKVQQVGQELGIRFVLAGSVLKSGKRIRITVNLVDTISSHHLWTEQFDRELTDFFEILDEVAQKTAVSIQSELTQGQQALRSLGTRNFKAWGYYMKGASHLRHFTKFDNKKAQELFTKAVQTDSEFALAWLMLAWTFFIDWRHGFSLSPDDSFNKALEVGKKATSMDDQLPEVHSFWNTVYLGQRNFEKAIAEGRKAIELNPNNAVSYLLLSQTMRYVGKFKEAIYLSEKAMRLCPRYPVWYLTLSAPAYIEAELYDQALSILKTALEHSRKGEISPSLVLPHLTVAYIRIGKESQAYLCAKELIQFNPEFKIDKDFEQLFYKDEKFTENYLNDLHKAGLK